MATVNEINAYKFQDNFRIESEDGLNFVCLEHNQQEAQAVARYLTDYHGKKYVAVKNGIDDVKAAKAIRPGCEVIRIKHREMILKTMKVWL